MFADIFVMSDFELLHVDNEVVDEFVDALLGFDVHLGQLGRRPELHAQSVHLLHLMGMVRRHTLALFAPAHHCISGALTLKADKCGFDSRVATAENLCGLLFNNHEILANMIYK
jgi:hypothetical protein